MKFSLMKFSLMFIASVISSVAGVEDESHGSFLNQVSLLLGKNGADSSSKHPRELKGKKGKKETVDDSPCGDISLTRETHSAVVDTFPNGHITIAERFSFEGHQEGLFMLASNPFRIPTPSGGVDETYMMHGVMQFGDSTANGVTIPNQILVTGSSQTLVDGYVVMPIVGGLGLFAASTGRLAYPSDDDTNQMILTICRAI